MQEKNKSFSEMFFNGSVLCRDSFRAIKAVFAGRLPSLCQCGQESRVPETKLFIFQAAKFLGDVVPSKFRDAVYFANF
jgi:hypothetical protein